MFSYHPYVFHRSVYLSLFHLMRSPSYRSMILLILYEKFHRLVDLFMSFVFLDLLYITTGIM